MALNIEVEEAGEADFLEELAPSIELLCLKYGARITLPVDIRAEENFAKAQEAAALLGLRLTRYPRWYLGDDDEVGRGMDRLTFEAIERHAILLAFDNAATMRKAAQR
ncbi:MAG TPA: hypothetical protein VFP15_06490 [Gemmatimonadaceae bacterium]|nr:hypothetical protein [Gemmatimonadaceae bacterium]